VNALASRPLSLVRGEGSFPIGPGDIIRTGSNSYPYYRVIAISEDRAWIRDVQNGTDHVVPTARCHRITDPIGSEDRVNVLQRRFGAVSQNSPGSW
jgi:hypothetical protein